MSFDPLLTVLGLTALASATVPTTFTPTVTRGGVAISAAALPAAPTTGTLAIDSGDTNKLKWWNGAAWQTAGGGGGGTPAGADTEIQYNNAGAFGASSELSWNSTTFGLRVTRPVTLGTVRYGSFIQENITGVASSSNTTTNGLYSYVSNASTGTHANLNMTGIVGEVASLSGSSANSGTLKAIAANVTAYGSPNTAIGIDVSLNNCTSVTSTVGMRVTQTHIAAATTNVYGLDIVNAGGSNTYTNQYGVKIGANVGTVTNAYALHIDATGGTVTNRYGIYQLGTAASNLFEAVSSQFNGSIITSSVYAAEFGFATSLVPGGAYIQSTLLGNGFQARVKPVVLPAELVFTASFNETSSRPEFTVYGLLLPPGPLPGTPTLGTVAIDWSGNVLKWYNGTSWQAAGVTIPLSLGVPSAEGADRALTNTDNGKNLICTGTRIFTVNTGLTSGFGCSFKGTVSFTGTATVTDVRTTGATNPWCALCQTGVDTYDIVGSKV